jgi:DNA invertase Pin-like site-specific DNA recombinase
VPHARTNGFSIKIKTEKIMSKKIALYCRVSTGNQSTGLEAQIRALRDYCSRNAISDYVIYEDENQSDVKQFRHQRIV